MNTQKKPRLSEEEVQPTQSTAETIKPTEVKIEGQVPTAGKGRVKRKTKRPGRYLNCPPPSENKPRCEKVNSLSVLVSLLELEINVFEL